MKLVDTHSVQMKTDEQATVKLTLPLVSFRRTSSPRIDIKWILGISARHIQELTGGGSACYISEGPWSTEDSHQFPACQ